MQVDVSAAADGDYAYLDIAIIDVIVEHLLHLRSLGVIVLLIV